MNNTKPNKPKKPRVNPLTKRIDELIATVRKQVEKEFEPRVQERIKEYMAKHMPELEARREELAKKVEYYDKITNKHKPVFTKDDYKIILMCLHPDGERTKEKLEEAFRLFKDKETQLTGKR
jgi:hypothetical protein